MIESKIANGKSSLILWMVGILSLASLLCSCSGQGPKYKQYFAQGQVLYEKNCSNCHQKNGTGLGLLYPPLASSDYLEKNFNLSLCLMKYGIKGELTVNGKNFNKPMPGVPSLTELELAEIATYLGNAWGRQMGIVEITQVNAALTQCGMK
jgi:cytochrome c551